MSDIASALTASVAKDGQTTMTANLPMGGFKLTNLAAGSASTDSVRLGQLQGETGVYVSTVGGTADAITLTPSPAITGYAAGQRFSFISSGANTTAVTVAVSGLSAQAVTKNGSTALVAGDIPSGALVVFHYDGTRFQLIGGVPNAVLTSGSQTVAGDKTFSGDTTFDGEVDLSGDVDVGGSELLAGQAIVSNAAGDGVIGWVPGGYIYGLNMTNAADADHDITIATGEASDGTRAVVMKLTSALTKQFDATFAEGDAAGGMASGESIPTSGTLNIWLIAKADVTTVDVFGNNHATSGLSPSLPSGFIYKRYIGAWRTDSSANIRAGTWRGDTFTYNSDTADVSTALTPTQAAVTLSVPPLAIAHFRASIYFTGDTVTDHATTILYSDNAGDVTPDVTAGRASLSGCLSDTSVTQFASGHFSLRASSSSTIKHDSVLDSGVAGTLTICTYGYTDTRRSGALD